MLARNALWVLAIFFTFSSQAALGFEELDIRDNSKKTETKSPVQEDHRVVGVTNTEVPPEPKAQPKRAAAPERKGFPRISLRARTPARPYALYPDFRMRVGLLMNESDLSGLVGFRFYQSQFMTINGQFRYRGHREEPFQESYFGPEGLAHFQLPNLTIVTPFAAGGVGYEAWKVSLYDEVASRSGSLYLTASFGVELNMTPGFGLVIARSVRWYENPLPNISGGTLHNHELEKRSQVEVLFHYLI